MSSHHNENLIDMVNRIALFFEAFPDHAEALQGVANHVQKFWEPRMRRQLAEIAKGAEARDLHPLVAEAIRTGVLKLETAAAH